MSYVSFSDIRDKVVGCKISRLMKWLYTCYLRRHKDYTQGHNCNLGEGLKF